jgi:shikimate kinase
MGSRTVIIIGRTGAGKSAVANALAGKRLFNESDSSISVTKGYQLEEFVVEDMRVQV